MRALRSLNTKGTASLTGNATNLAQLQVLFPPSLSSQFPSLSLSLSNHITFLSSTEHNVDRIEVEPPIVVKSIPAPRPAAPAPQFAPIERSSAYLLRHRRRLESDDEDDTDSSIVIEQDVSLFPSSSTTHIDFLRSDLLLEQEKERGVSSSESDPSPPSEPFTGGAVEWWLKKADKNLNEIESNPPMYAKVMYNISTGPVGAAASKSLEVAADVGGRVAKETLKAAGPASKWVVKQGFKLIAGVVMKGISGKGNSKDGSK